MKCELLEGCPFFQTPKMSSNSDIVNSLIEVYCKGNPLLCARRRVAIAVGREKVPDGLSPNHMHLVQKIIELGLMEQ
jgi:hypothetical protein